MYSGGTAPLKEKIEEEKEDPNPKNIGTRSSDLYIGVFDTTKNRNLISDVARQTNMDIKLNINYGPVICPNRTYPIVPKGEAVDKCVDLTGTGKFLCHFCAMVKRGIGYMCYTCERREFLAGITPLADVRCRECQKIFKDYISNGGKSNCDMDHVFG